MALYQQNTEVTIWRRLGEVSWKDLRYSHLLLNELLCPLCLAHGKREKRIIPDLPSPCIWQPWVFVELQSNSHCISVAHDCGYTTS